MIETGRLIIAPFEMKYLNHYFSGFNAEITRYQWPDPFESVEDARAALEAFLNEMDRKETLIFSILSRKDAFLGSVEIHGLTGECPEVGVWIIASEQKKGYAYEALSAVLEHVRLSYGKTAFYYEADIRNAGSIKLLRKFSEGYEIIDQGLERLTTDSGKDLELQGYMLKAK